MAPTLTPPIVESMASKRAPAAAATTPPSVISPNSRRESLAIRKLLKVTGYRTAIYCHTIMASVTTFPATVRATAAAAPRWSAFRVLGIGVGVFFIAMSMNKIQWLSQPDLLLNRFVKWAPVASAPVRWYLQHIAIPAAPLLARAIPIGEFSVGVAFILGIAVRPAAILALFLVLNFHFGTSAFFAWEFLRDGTGPPLLAALLAMAIG